MQTDVSYSDEIDDYELASIIDNYSSSDYDIVGYKTFFINGITPGKPITFNIDAAGAGYRSGSLDMQSIKPVEALMFLFKIGINRLLKDDLSDFIRSPNGFGGIFDHVKKLDDSSGGEIIIKPKFNFLAGRFVAKQRFWGMKDTCIITDYQPNIDNPEQGGTFTLGGL